MKLPKSTKEPAMQNELLVSVGVASRDQKSPGSCISRPLLIQSIPYVLLSSVTEVCVEGGTRAAPDERGRNE